MIEINDVIVEDYLNSIIDKPIPDNRGVRFYKKPPEFLNRRTVEGRFHIIFVAYYPDPHLLKKALTLRSSGEIFLTLLAGCIREDVGIENFFRSIL